MNHKNTSNLRNKIILSTLKKAVKTPKVWKYFFVIFIFTLVFLVIYSFVHEIVHFTACNLVGLDSKISINLMQNPPLFQALCDGINEKSVSSKFLFWGAPYVFTLIILVLFLFLWNKKNIYLISLPLAVLMSVLFNLWGFCKFAFTLKGSTANDLVQIVAKTSNPYLMALLLVIGTIIVVFILTLKSVNWKFLYPI